MSKHKTEHSAQEQIDPNGTNKIIIAIILALSFIAIAFLITRTPEKTDDTANNEPQKYNVTESNGTQIIELKAKGGYTPRVTLAKAGIPTILRVNTSGTFDCSSAIRIPSLGVSKNLPQSGVTDIDLGTQKVGTLPGSCGMGMYPFEIRFE